MTNQATPRPWRLWEESQNFILADANKGKEFVIGEIYDNKNYIERNDHEVIPNKEQGLANAKLIVKAVNCHDELVEKLKALIHQIDINDYVDSHGHEAKMLQALHLAKQALSKAQGGDL